MSEKREYVKLWLSYASYFEAYGAAEVGRLVLAMIKYRASGVEPEFSGSERFIWPAIKRDIDESMSAQELAAEAHRESGKKGGRPRKPKEPEWIPENQSCYHENQKNQIGFQESKKSHGQGQGQGQGKGQGQSSPDGDDTRARDPAVATVVDTYLNKINPDASPISLEKLVCYTKTMGPDCCIRAMDIALDEKKPQWSFIEGILRKKASQGVRCIADWDALEARREEQKRGDVQSAGAAPGGSYHGWRAKSALDDAD